MLRLWRWYTDRQPNTFANAVADHPRAITCANRGPDHFRAHLGTDAVADHGPDPIADHLRAHPGTNTLADRGPDTVAN